MPPILSGRRGYDEGGRGSAGALERQDLYFRDYVSFPVRKYGPREPLSWLVYLPCPGPAFAVFLLILSQARLVVSATTALFVIEFRNGG